MLYIFITVTRKVKGYTHIPITPYLRTHRSAHYTPTNHPRLWKNKNVNWNVLLSSIPTIDLQKCYRAHKQFKIVHTKTVIPETLKTRKLGVNKHIDSRDFWAAHVYFIREPRPLQRLQTA